MTRRTNLIAMAAAAGAGVFALASSWTVPAEAQEWPQDDITIVVAYPAGGGTDSAIRAMTEILSRELGQNILVQNVGGAGGGVAATQVMSRDADGYTLLATNSTSITLAPLVERTAYDIDDFEHVAILGEFQNAVFANKDMPFGTLDELVDLVKNENRPMTYASQLAIDRLLMQYIAKERGIELLPLPVSGGNGAVQAVLSGDVDVSFSGGSWAPLVNAGDAKALFAASHGRLKVAPDLISMGDMGFPFGVTSHISLHAPAGTPEEVLEKISAAFEPAVAGEQAQNVGETRFMDMTFRGLAEAREVIRKERETYQAILDSLEQEETSEQ
ncbi:tripartite tricarboxylate transporter substrate binding protein [Chelativorans sp. AA-79]|uniref:tripartite tricarboxylate transporter substrate binding protein n=1 Tax=Chelativorans sp. AA-79 TaxID=3028735 RepID=UPI0023F761C5|nr:tripartite tricarboxylate transporter substrate binding protein [Chelativorans sp. AA-79]WEX08055.1 tripartite tricarboxylate transporter substrate binding protein [Chelativorans sp. AA-79]